MASFNHSVDMGDTVRGLTATVTLTTRRWTKFRIGFGLLVVRFGCWLMGVGAFEAQEPNE